MLAGVLIMRALKHKRLASLCFAFGSSKQGCVASRGSCVNANVTFKHKAERIGFRDQWQQETIASGQSHAQIAKSFVFGDLRNRIDPLEFGNRFGFEIAFKAQDRCAAFGQLGCHGHSTLANQNNRVPSHKGSDSLKKGQLLIGSKHQNDTSRCEGQAV